MSEIKLIRAPGYQNTGSQRDYCYYRETILQELIPIVDVLDLVTFPPRKGAIGFDGVTGMLYYANGVAWLPVGTSTPVTLSSADTETLIAAASAYPNFLLKGLKAGTDIQLVPTATDLTINFTGVDGAGVTLTLDPFALGANLIDNGTGPNLVLKGIQGGTDISAVANGTDVVISYTGSSGSDVTLSLQPGAVGQNLITDGLGPALALRGVAAGPHISVTSDITDVTVGFTGTTGDDVTLALAGGAAGQSIVNDGVGPALAVKGVAAGSNISVTSSPTDLTIAYTGSTGGDVTLSKVVGSTGEDWVVDGTGPSLSIKGFLSTNEVKVINGANDLTARQSYAYAETSVNTALTEADNHLGVHTAIAAVTVTLPLISTLSFFQKQFVISDLDGNAPMNNITIQSTAPDTIQVMGGGPILMNTKFGSIVLYSTNTGKWCLM
jgi:hypothetical protein